MLDNNQKNGLYGLNQLVHSLGKEKIYISNYAENLEKVILENISEFKNKDIPTVNIRQRSPYVFMADIHGNLSGLLKNLYALGVIDDKGNYIPSKKLKKIVFLGDYIDRGKHSIETLLYLKVLNAQANENEESLVFLLGNHEYKYLSGGDLKKKGSKDTTNLSFDQKQIVRSLIFLFVKDKMFKLVFSDPDNAFICSHAGLRKQELEKFIKSLLFRYFEMDSNKFANGSNQSNSLLLSKQKYFELLSNIKSDDSAKMKSTYLHRIILENKLLELLANEINKTLLDDVLKIDKIPSNLSELMDASKNPFIKNSNLYKRLGVDDKNDTMLRTRWKEIRRKNHFKQEFNENKILQFVGHTVTNLQGNVDFFGNKVFMDTGLVNDGKVKNGITRHSQGFCLLDNRAIKQIKLLDNNWIKRDVLDMSRHKFVKPIQQFPCV